MANIYRIKAIWTGMPGAPGVSTFYLKAAPVAADLTAVRTFFNTLLSGLPNTLTISVPGSGDVVRDTDGELQASWAATAPSPTTGTSASGYAGASGTLCHWQTADIADGRRVRGTTYIVPTVNQFEPGGTPLAAWLGTLTGAAEALRISLGANFVVWHRPKFGPKPGPGIPRPLIRNGSSHDVTAVTVPDKAVVLRSRRD